MTMPVNPDMLYIEAFSSQKLMVTPHTHTLLSHPSSGWGSYHCRVLLPTPCLSHWRWRMSRAGRHNSFSCSYSGREVMWCFLSFNRAALCLGREPVLGGESICVRVWSCPYLCLPGQSSFVLLPCLTGCQLSHQGGAFSLPLLPHLIAA